MVVDTQENCVDNNSCHYYVLESLGLHDFEALQSETVDWFHRNDLRICVHKQSLNFHPFLLLFCEVVCTLSFLDLFVELINNNRNK